MDSQSKGSTLSAASPSSIDLITMRRRARAMMGEARADEAAKLYYYVSTFSRDAADLSDACWCSLHADMIDADNLHRMYARRFIWPGTPPLSKWDGNRPLRIGYVSPFFRGHTTAKFLLPIIENHSDAVAVYLYSDTPKSDKYTERFKANCHVWRDAGHLKNSQLAAQVIADGIDVLIDRQDHLNGGNRLGMFAMRPAPVIASYSGHPHPSYVPGMVRITDAIVDPVETGEAMVRLDGCMRAYRPDDEAPEVAPAPFIANGYVTFGSFNRAPKITPTMAGLWAEVLRRMPTAHLSVLAKSGEDNKAVRRLLESKGVDGARLVMIPETDNRAYLDLFAGIDTLLDTFPYNGTTTICDSLWQGVPVVMLAGDSVRSRMGASLLTAARLTDWIASSPEQYVGTAIALATDRSALLRHRETLRGRMGESALCDGKAVVMRLEAALFKMITGK